MLSLIAAILAVVAGFAAREVAGLVDPSLHYITRNCIGAGIFAVVAIFFLAVLQWQARRIEN